jgi:hypothetical protein
MDRIPGRFVPLDVHYAADPAIRRVGYRAELIFVRALARCRADATHDGVVREYDLPSLVQGIPQGAREVAALVREGLWVPCDGGWEIRSWAKWNPRSAHSRGGAWGNHVRWHRDGRTSPDCPFCREEAESIGTDSVPSRYRLAPMGDRSGPIRGDTRPTRKPGETDTTRRAKRTPRVVRIAPETPGDTPQNIGTDSVPTRHRLVTESLDRDREGEGEGELKAS